MTIVFPTKDKAAAPSTATLKWARQHDWGRNAVLDNGVLFIDHQDEGLLSFFSNAQLRSWAGY